MGDLIKLTRIPPKKPKISISEFNITTLFINEFELDYESDFSLSYKYLPLTCGDRTLGYAEKYEMIDLVPKEFSLFRPLKNDKHANLIIEMFDDLNLIRSDNLEIKEFMKNGRKKYSGYLLNGTKVLKRSIVKIAPSIPILKVSIIASIMLDHETYEYYYKNLINYLSKDNR